MTGNKVLLCFAAVALASCSGSRVGLRSRANRDYGSASSQGDLLEKIFRKDFVEFSQGHSENIEFYGHTVTPRRKRNMQELDRARERMERRKRLNKNKARNMAYREAKKIKESAESEIEKTKKEKKNMIMLKGRQVFVNKRRRQLIKKTKTPVGKARSLSTVYGPKQGVRADIQGSDYIKDKNMSILKDEVRNLENAIKELKTREKEQIEEAAKVHEKAEKKVNRFFRKRRKNTNTKTNIINKNDMKMSSPSKIIHNQPNIVLKIKPSQNINNVPESLPLKKSASLFDNSKFFIHMFLPKPMYMKPKERKNIL